MKKFIFATTAVLALGVGFEATAQTAQTAQEASVDEIIVTAQRREERLIDVPLSVTALSSESLAKSGITNSRDLVLVTPGLRFDAVGSTVQPTIRGVTTTLAGGSETNVAIYVDGVIQVASQAAIFELPDVQQVEVLKGPQGTLFGRNATGGAILIRTLAPDLNEVTGQVLGSYSSFDTKKLQGFVSVPVINDKLAVSLAGHYERMSKGYLEDLTQRNRTHGGEVETQLLRGKVRFLPWEGADFTLQGTYQKRNDHAILRNSNWRGNNAQAITGAYTGPLADEAWEYAVDVDPYSLTKQWNVSLRGDIDMGPGTLTTTTVYVDNHTFLLNDSDNTPLARAVLTNEFDIGTFTQELLYSTDQLGRFRAVGGLYFFDSKIKGNLRSNSTAFVDWNRVDNTAYAAFGEATYDITDQLALTGGVRYSWEKKKAYKRSVFGSAVRPDVIPLLGKKSWDSLDPRVSLVYKAADRTNVYATFSKGFKSGEFNVSGASAQFDPIDPERITAYEIGVKSDVTRNLFINLAGFHYNYKDLQVTAFESVFGVITSRLTNAASAKIWGAEFNADWRATREWRFALGVSYLDAKYDDFPGASFTTPRSELPGAVCPVPPSSSATLPICTVTANLKGAKMVRAPQLSGNLTGSYTKELDAGTLDASATLFASTKVYFDVSNRVVQPNYTLLNLSLSWQPAGSDLKFRLWGKNVTDEPVIVSLVNTSSYDTVTYMPPQSFGVDVSYKF